MELERYPSITYKPATIETIHKGADNDSFVAVDTTGVQYTGRKLVLATGVIDLLPDIEGLRAIWGSGAFWCMWCDLYERLNGPVAFFGLDSVFSALTAIKVKRNDYTVLTDGMDPHLNLIQLSEDSGMPLEKLVVENNIGFENRTVKSFSFVDSLAEDSSVRVSYMEGDDAIYRGVFISSRAVPRGNLHLQLGVEVHNVTDRILTQNRQGQTNIPGVYAVGDAGSEVKNILSAQYGGKSAAVEIVHVLFDEDALWQQLK